MIKEMNQEQSMNPNVKNMGRSYGLEYNQLGYLGYPFSFCSIPKLYLFQLGENPAYFQPLKKHLIFL